jgi:membrane peptidoglycan carboxypeptidase
MVGYTPSVSTAVWVGTDQSDPIRNSAGRPVFGRMLPGSIWQTFMTGALRGTPVEQFSPFVALGAPPVVVTESDGSDDEDSDEKSDEDKDKNDSDSDSDSDSSSSGSGSSSDSDSSGDSRGSGSDSGSDGRSSSDDSSNEGAAFDQSPFDVPGLRSSSQPVSRTSGRQPLTAGTP